MDFDQLYPKRFMKAGELNAKPLTLTIASVKREELGDGDDKQGKVVVSFERTKKQWIANVTNGTCLKAMFGRTVENWIGKRVTLMPVQITDPFTGELTLAIRVQGSPDIDGTKEFQARIGRKQVKFRLVKTGKVAAAVPLKAETPPVPDAGEVEASEEPTWMPDELGDAQ